MADETASAPAEGAPKGEAGLIRFLSHPRLAPRLALLSVLFSSPALFLGFYLDDWVGRYIYSDLPGAKELYRLYSGGYGLATGVPAEMHAMIEAGWAPWWSYEHLRLSLYRPLSLLTHHLDELWLDNAFLMHAHNFVWLFLLVLAVTRLYRGALGLVAGGMAALLFALDHTHGFIVGYICNRHALVTALFGVLALDLYLRARKSGDARVYVLSLGCYVLSLLSGEAGVSIAAYVLAHAAVSDPSPLSRRVLHALPFLLATVIWRAAYSNAGFGALGSGLYLDPAREPVHFLLALFERGPILLLGLFFMPPAELYAIASPWLAVLLLSLAALAIVLLVVAFGPLLLRERTQRFWALGLVLSLVPAASTYPHNRQLLFASIGAMALIARLWELFAFELRGKNVAPLLMWSGRVGGLVLVMHLVVSPLALPFTSCGIAVAAPLQRAPSFVGDEIAGRDAVFVTAPEYFAVRLVQLVRRVEEKPLPRRVRALSFGAQDVTVTRTRDTTLELHYEGGILNEPFMELFRDRRIPMHVGERIELKGLQIEVLALTPDGRAERARFTFDTSLDASSFVFYAWIDERFTRWTPPAVGQSVTLPAATVSFGPF